MRAFLVALTILFVTAKLPYEITINEVTFIPKCVSDLSSVQMKVIFSESIGQDIIPEIHFANETLSMTCEINETEMLCMIENPVVPIEKTIYQLESIKIGEETLESSESFTYSPEANEFGINENQEITYSSQESYQFKIVFTNDATNTHYVISVGDGKEYDFTNKCSVNSEDNKIILCNFSKEDFPAEGGKSTYTITVTNICEDSISFQLTVNENVEPKVYNAEANFTSHCPDFTPLEIEVKIVSEDQISANLQIILGPTKDDTENCLIECEGITSNDFSCSGNPDISLLADPEHIKIQAIKDKAGLLQFTLTNEDEAEYNPQSFDVVKNQPDAFIDYSNEEKNYFTIQFTNQIKGIEEPEVKVNSKEIRCEISTSSDTELNCYPNEDEVPVGNHTVYIISACGDEIKLFDLSINRTEPKTFVSLGDPTIPFSTCMNFKSNFSIEFPIKEKVSNYTPSVIFENDPNNYLEIECNTINPELAEQNLICDKISEILDDNKTENEEFFLKRVIDQNYPNIGFNLTEAALATKIIYNSKANPIVQPTDQKIDYSSDDKKMFNIIFEQILTEELLPNVTVGDNIAITCEAKDAVLTCTPDQKVVEPGKDGKEKEYKVAVTNQCGGKDELFSIFVSKSSSLFIKVTGVVFLVAAILF